jgi:hypothetical protein
MLTKNAITYVLAGWEGSAADGRVLRDTINRRNELRVPHDMENIFANLIILGLNTSLVSEF